MMIIMRGASKFVLAFAARFINGSPIIGGSNVSECGTIAERRTGRCAGSLKPARGFLNEEAALKVAISRPSAGSEEVDHGHHH
jgi:hypothetical protein